MKIIGMRAKEWYLPLTEKYYNIKFKFDKMLLDEENDVNIEDEIFEWGNIGFSSSEDVQGFELFNSISSTFCIY